MVLASLGAGAAWAVLGACGDDERDAQADGGARLELIMDEPATIDPGLATQPHEFGIVRALFEPLLDIGPGGAPRPAAAASWQITDAGRAYTFKLRPDARWSNGELLSADDFLWAWQRNLNPQVGGAFNYLMFPIRGAERVANGEFQSIDSVDIFAPDPQTLRVRLEQPTPGFLARLAAATFLPLPRAEIEGAGFAWTTPRNIRSNGAHRLAQWDRGVGMTLFRNEHHSADPSPFREIVVRFPQQDRSLASAFRSSTVHAAQVHGQDYRSARNDPALRDQLRLFERSGTWFVVFNTAKPPWNNPAVRRALSMVLDRDSLVARVFDEPTLPAHALTPPSILPRDKPPAPPDIEGARALLAQAGHANGEGLPVARFTYHRTETWQRLATELAQRWGETLGVRIEPDEREWRDFLAFTDDPGDFDLYRAGWTSEYRDPVNWYDDLWRSDRDFLRAHWDSPEFDAHLAAATRATTDADRMTAYAAADAVLEAQAPAIPIGYRAAAFLLKPTVRSFGIEPISGAIDLRAISIQRSPS